MHSQNISVSYAGQVRQIPLAEPVLAPFLRSAQRAFSLSIPVCLAFQTSSGDRAAVSSDVALQLVIGADPAAGRLVLSLPADLPTVDQCMHTVLQAVVDTAARGEAAAVFLALSGAWEHAVRDFGDVRLADTAESSLSSIASEQAPSPNPTPLRKAMWHSAAASGDAGEPSGVKRSPSPARRSPSPLRGLHASLNRALEGRISAESGGRVTEAACGWMTDMGVDEARAWETRCRAAAETRALACFGTHAGVSCAQCHVNGIQGARYQCRTGRKDINFCERCRRAVGDGGEGRSFTVYDHPWEATEDYAESNEMLRRYTDSLKAPPPPLELGDIGPRVMHLHYVLYTVGYLNVGTRGFYVGRFCETTRAAIARFQRDYCVALGGEEGELGVYSALTRSVLLSLFEELEQRGTGRRCAAVSRPQSPRLRTAMAA